ncbi:DUF4352 domain-containing protein [Propioniciclava soli]|uniref:DUF4352 domain-containing protein n=1 Tax=Propioniciclava soli TaxID=2775081 RepID=A0ABZ3CEA6_9ACTN|nr:DUF4352 domain-containing protein [Propioniciclava soli]
MTNPTTPSDPEWEPADPDATRVEPAGHGDAYADAYADVDADAPASDPDASHLGAPTTHSEYTRVESGMAETAVTPRPITSQWWFWALLAALVAGLVIWALTSFRGNQSATPAATPTPSTVVTATATTSPSATAEPSPSATASATASGTGTPSPSATSTATTTPGSDLGDAAGEELHPLGSVVSSGPLDLVVHNATFDEPSGGTRRLVVDVTVTNNDAAALPLIPGQFVAVTPQMSGDQVEFVRHQLDEAATADLGTAIFDAQVQPGEAAQGQLVYEVPADAVAYALAFRGTTDASIVGIDLGRP